MPAVLPFQLKQLSDAPTFIAGLDADAIDVTRLPFGAVFDGRDNTTIIQAAINYAASSTRSKTVLFPSGLCKLSATITVPTLVKLKGQGRTTTRFYKTADYGDMFRFGTFSTLSYESGGAEGFWAYHDYGNGPFPSNTPVVNPCTTGSIFSLYQPSHCMFSDLWLGGGQNCWYSWGGVSNSFIGVRTYGIWDPQVSALQSTLSGFTIDGDATSIPTDFEFEACQLAGVTSPVRSIVWPGTGHTTTTVVQNIGPKSNLLVRCCEGVRFIGGYIGAASYHGVRLYPRAGSPMAGVVVRDTFVDANGTAGLMLDNSAGVSPQQVVWAPSEHAGQFNALCAISDADGNLSNPSVIGLNVSGNFRTFVGPAFQLKNAYKAMFDVVATDWNVWGFYNSNADSLNYDAGLILKDDCFTVQVKGVWGGGNAGVGSGSPPRNAYAVRCNFVSGRNIQASSSNILTGIGTSLSAAAV